MFFIRARLIILYVLFELLPSLILGASVFVFILLMFQALRLTEFVLVHGVQISEILKMMVYLTISFLPIILPMSLLFSVLLTYGRLNGDSEIIAMKSLGLSFPVLSLPAVILGVLTTFVSAQTSFFLAPWGNRQFELMIADLGKIKAAATIREGVFSEGFFDLVVYASQVDSKEGKLKKVFIFDERDSRSPLTIIAHEGQIIQSKTDQGNKALLRLIDGDIHRTTGITYTKIDFKSYDISLFDPALIEERKKSILSYNLKDIQSDLKSATLDPVERRKLEIEFHRRAAMSFACFIFALLGMGFGTSVNRRSGKGGGFALCLGLIILYWVSYITIENFTKKSVWPVGPMIWMTNIFFSGITLWSLYRSSRSSH